VLTLDCSASGAATDPYNFGQVSMYTGDVATFNVPDGSRCDVATVTRPRLRDSTSYMWYRDVYNPPTPFTVSGDVDESVSHAITSITMRTITVTKAVTGVTTSGTYTIHVDCGGSNKKDMTLAHGGTDSMLAPLGSVCRVTEDDLAGVNSTAVIAPAGFVVAGDQTVQVTNRTSNTPITKATLTVTKTVTGTTTAHDPTNAFGIRVACTTTPVADFTLLADQSATVEGKVGDTCTTTEPTIPTLAGGYHYAPSIVPSKATLSGATAVSVENEVTNKSTHLVTLTNAVGGPNPTEFDHSGKFTLSLDCGTGIKVSSMVLGDEASYSIPDSANCTVSTTARPNPNSTFVWDPSQDTYSLSTDKGPLGRFVTRPVDETETVTHWLQKNRGGGLETIAITKTLTGNTSLYAGGHFDVTVTCDDGTHEAVQFAPTGTQTVSATAGAKCTVTESTAGANLSGGTSRRTIVPSKFTVPVGGQSVSVENELLDGSVRLAPLEVAKVVTGDLSKHNPANVFHITVACATLADKQFNLLGGQSGVTDAVVGSTCAIAEPTVPTLTAPYAYLPSIIPSSVAITASGRSAQVVNEVVDGTVAPAMITFTQGPTQDVTGSGYVAAVLHTTLTCGTHTFDLALAEGDRAIVALPIGSSCTGTKGMLPTLNAGYSFSDPKVSGNWPYSVTHDDSLTLWYVILPPSPQPTSVPIPTLDEKALMLLIGLLAGLALWQGRQRRRAER